MKPVIIQLQMTIITLALASPLNSFAMNERAWPIITFTCDKTKNEVKLKNEAKWGIAGEKFPFNAAQGTYNPWDLVNILDRGSRRLVSEKKKLELKCRLGENDYTFIVRPKIFNVNFNGNCGDRLSVLVSIHKNRSILLEDKAMESFCHGNSPVLKGFKVKDGDNKVHLFEVPRSRFY